MKIAIDLNDVIRDFTRNFAKVYDKEYGTTSDDISVTTNNLNEVFDFESIAEYNRFVYQDYSYELFGKCDTTSKMVQSLLINWVEQLKNIDTEEEIDVMIVSPMEYGLTIQSTYFFLSKIGCRIREVYFPTDSSTVWGKCDVLITANPRFLDNKPEGKKTVMIKTDYNTSCSADFVYEDVCEFFNDINNTIELMN